MRHLVRVSFLLLAGLPLVASCGDGTGPGSGRNQIAFASRQDNAGLVQLYLVNDDGTGLTLLLSDSSTNDTDPAWAPDGASLAYTGDGDIYTMSPDGSGRTKLTNHPAGDYVPTWSSDGSQIAFQSIRDGNYEIYRMNRDGTGVARVTNNAPANDFEAAWSPDGSQIAFVSDRDGNYEIYLMNSDGSLQTRLTDSPGNDFRPTWSPDGSRIAFQSDRDGGLEVYLMNVDGSDPVRLTTGPSDPEFDGTPSWSPDGNRITYENAGRIAVVNVDGTGERILPSVGQFEVTPAWRP